MAAMNLLLAALALASCSAYTLAPVRPVVAAVNPHRWKVAPIMMVSAPAIQQILPSPSMHCREHRHACS